jgi:hypothetical protein
MKDNLNPDFKTTFSLFYTFEHHQYLKFEVVDQDSSTSWEEIGSVETSLGRIAGMPKFTFESDLHKGTSKENRGRIIVRFNPTKESTWDVTLKLGARNLTPITSCFCINNISPYFEVYKAVKAGSEF